MLCLLQMFGLLSDWEGGRLLVSAELLQNVSVILITRAAHQRVFVFVCLQSINRSLSVTLHQLQFNNQSQSLKHYLSFSQSRIQSAELEQLSALTNNAMTVKAFF